MDYKTMVEPDRASRILPKVLPFGVFVFTLLLNLLTVWAKGFDGLYGQDAYSYFAHGEELHQHLSILHHWQWEAESRPLFWPIGFPGVLALVFLLTGPSTGSAQLVSIVAWAGAAGLLTSLGIKLSGSELVGGIAGSLLALSPLGRQAAISIMADASAVFWTVLYVWLVLKARESAHGWYLGLAGVAFGLAIITRYIAATSLPLLIIAVVWSGPVLLSRVGALKVKTTQSHKFFVQPTDHSLASSEFTNVTKKLPLKWLLLALAVSGLVYLPQFVINQFYPASFWTNSWLTGWSPLNALQHQFSTRDGFASYATPPLVFYLGYSLLNLHLLTVLGLPLVGFGLFYLWECGKSNFILVFLATWWLVPVLVLSGIPFESERFSLTFLPPLAILAGMGSVWLAQRLPLFSFKERRSLITAMVVFTGLLGLGLLSQVHLDGFMAAKEADLAVVKQVEQRLPAQATLITFGISLTFDHYTAFKVRDLSFLDGATIANLLHKPPVYLLVDAQSINQQWQGYPVGFAYDTAMTYTEKGQPLGQFGRYYLWKLNL